MRLIHGKKRDRALAKRFQEGPAPEPFRRDVNEFVFAAGESAITTTNRNFKGRMGSNEAFVHLANAWVAAAAAVAGEIVHPADVIGRVAA